MACWNPAGMGKGFPGRLEGPLQYSTDSAPKTILIFTERLGVVYEVHGFTRFGRID